MTFGESLKRFFGRLVAVPELARSETVASLIPPDTRYVTLGRVAVLPDVAAFNGGSAGAPRYGRALGYLPAKFRQELALLVLAGDRLSVVERAGTRWSCEVGRITDLDGHRSSGFLVFTTRPEGLAVGPQTPVQVPPGAGFETVRGVTNLFSGWDERLGQFGVRRHF